MSRTPNGRIRTKSSREAFVDQSPYHRHGKRKSWAHSYDDTDIAYRSAPEYLRQLLNTSTNSARSVTRTNSACEMTPRNLGNPKYKAQEDYYDEVQLLKKELKSFKDDNSNLRARIRRLEEDNARKHKEIDGLYDTNKDGDLRRTLAGSSTPTNSVVMNLKQRLFKIELQLKQKETNIEEMKNDPRWTKGTELEIQNRALFNELEKQKLERLNFIQHDYMAAIDEEKKNAVRKLENEKRELKTENESLKKKLADRGEQVSARQRDESNDQKLSNLKELCRNYEHEIDQMKDDLKQMRRERDKFRDKFENIKEDFEETKRQRDQYRQKLDRVNDLDTGGRSSPTFKRTDDRQTKRPPSAALHRDSHSPEELSKKDSRPTTPIRKSNEHINARSSLISKKSSQNLRQNTWTSDDDYRVKKFREKHAATVIQRGWKKHQKSHKTKQDSFEKRASKPSGIASPRASQQKLGSKIDNFGSGTIKNRPSSANTSNTSALKTVQAVLRGYLNRTGLEKSSRTQRDDHDTSWRPNGSDRYKQNDKMGSTNRDSIPKLRRTPSPPHDIPPSPRTASRQSLQNEKNKSSSNNRLDRDSSFRKTPLNSKQSLKNLTKDDDDDIIGF